MRLALIAVLAAAYAHAPPHREVSDADGRIAAAVRKGDAAAIAAEFTRDAVMLPAGMDPVRGRDAIRGLFEQILKAGVTDAAITPDDVQSCGDFAFETGTNSITMNGQTKRGKYLVVWKLEDGAWKIYRDIGN